MRKKNIRIMITALLTAVLSFSPIAAHAEPSDASKEDPQEVLEEISMEEAPMGEASVEEMSMGTPMEELSMEEILEEEGEETEGIPEGVFVHTEGFSRNYSMNGLFSQCIEYFNTEEWHIRSAEFIMIYDVTQLKDGDISDFTVSLNGEPFYSGRFLQETNGKQTLRLVLPMELIKDGINELKIESYVRTRDSLPCVDDVSQANWFNISADSAVNIVYMPDTYAGTIADFYRKLTSIYAMENQKSAVFIPSAITDTAITAAANILTGVSKNAKADYQKLRLLTSENVLEECAAQGLDWAVYVGEWDFLPEAVKDGFSDALKKEMVTNGAALQLLSYEKVSLLVLTGTNPELLEKGAKMFGNADYMNQMTDTIHVITEQENPVMEKKEPLEYSALTAEGGMRTERFVRPFPSYRARMPTSCFRLSARFI